MTPPPAAPSLPAARQHTATFKAARFLARVSPPPPHLRRPSQTSRANTLSVSPSVAVADDRTGDWLASGRMGGRCGQTEGGREGVDTLRPPPICFPSFRPSFDTTGYTVYPTRTFFVRRLSSGHCFHHPPAPSRLPPAAERTSMLSRSLDYFYLAADGRRAGDGGATDGSGIGERWARPLPPTATARPSLPPSPPPKLLHHARLPAATAPASIPAGPGGLRDKTAFSNLGTILRSTDPHHTLSNTWR